MKLLLKRSFDHRLIYVLIHCRRKLILISFLFHVYVTAYMFMGLELGLSFIVVIVTCHLHELILPTFSFQLKMLNQIAVKHTKTKAFLKIKIPRYHNFFCIQREIISSILLRWQYIWRCSNNNSRDAQIYKSQKRSPISSYLTRVFIRNSYPLK